MLNNNAAVVERYPTCTSHQRCILNVISKKEGGERLLGSSLIFAEILKQHPFR